MTDNQILLVNKLVFLSLSLFPYFKGVYGQLIAAYGSELPKEITVRMEHLEKLASRAGELGTVTAALKTPFYFSSAFPIYFISTCVWVPLSNRWRPDAKI